ncbi:MAG TPA: hypothetical protein VIR79_07865 [Nitrospira sp.]
MKILPIVPIILISLLSSGWAAEPGGLPNLDSNNPAALREAVRLLEEEVKLAARPRTYVVIDLVAQTLHIKGRGVELYRFPIEQWTASGLEDIAVSFSLQQRPPVARRKVDPTAAVDAEQLPVSLADMPSIYALWFSPPLEITIQSPAASNFRQWVFFKGQTWWHWLRRQYLSIISGTTAPPTASLQLTMAPDHAQSLAWTVSENMPFLIRRASSH